MIVVDPTDAGVAKLSELIGLDSARAFRGECEPYERRLREAVVDYGYGQVWSSGRLDLKSHSSYSSCMASISYRGRASLSACSRCAWSA
jgi:hypothetical protein